MKLANSKRLLLSLLTVAALNPVSGYCYIPLANGDPSLSYPQKWGPNIWGTGATITWSFAADGVISDLAGYNGTNTLSALRANIDADNGVGAFDAVVNNAFATWADVTYLTFIQVADNGEHMAVATSPDIRIGAFEFADPCCGGAGYGPPGNSAFADPVAGDLFLNSLAGFKIYPYAEGDAYDMANDWQNDLQSLLVHEIGHTLGLGHPESDGLQGDEANAIMCVLSTCNAYTHLQRQLGADDIAGIQFIYGSPVPLPASFWLLGSGLMLLFGKRAKAYKVS